MTATAKKSARSVGPTTGAPVVREVATDGAPVFFSLPQPPSINEAYINRRNGRGRALAEKVVDWKSYASHVLRGQSVKKVSGPVLIIVNIERGSNAADVDNRVKLLFDFLVKQGVMDDDRHVAGFAVAWSPPASRMAHIAIYPSQELALSFHPSDKTGAVGGWAVPAPQHTIEEAR